MIVGVLLDLSLDIRRIWKSAESWINKLQPKLAYVSLTAIHSAYTRNPTQPYHAMPFFSENGFMIRVCQKTALRFKFISYLITLKCRKHDFDQWMACKAPTGWSKYTTTSHDDSSIKCRLNGRSLKCHKRTYWLIKLLKCVTKLGAVDDIGVESCPGLSGKSRIFAGSMLLRRFRSLLAPPPVNQLNSRLLLSLVRTC